MAIFRSQLKNNEIDNIHVRNELWLQNRENKIYNELKLKMDEQQLDCTHKPKINKVDTKK